MDCYSTTVFQEDIEVGPSDVVCGVESNDAYVGGTYLATYVCTYIDADMAGGGDGGASGDGEDMGRTGCVGAPASSRFPEKRWAHLAGERLGSATGGLAEAVYVHM